MSSCEEDDWGREAADVASGSTATAVEESKVYIIHVDSIVVGVVDRCPPAIALERSAKLRER